MDGPFLSQDKLQMFFAWAPLVLGLVIYAAYFVAKRHEFVTAAAAFGTTYACSTCGRRGAKEHMLPQTHDGAISYVCSKCSGGH